MNFFRIPLNIFVCVVLYNVGCSIYDLDIMLDHNKCSISVEIHFYISLI